MNFLKTTLLTVIATASVAHAGNILETASKFAADNASCIVEAKGAWIGDDLVTVYTESPLKSMSQALTSAYQEPEKANSSLKKALKSATKRSETKFILVYLDYCSNEELKAHLEVIKKADAQKPVVVAFKTNSVEQEAYILAHAKATCVLPPFGSYFEHEKLNYEQYRFVVNKHKTPIITYVSSGVSLAHDNFVAAFIANALQKRGVKLPLEVEAAAQQIDTVRNSCSENDYSHDSDYMMGFELALLQATSKR